MLTLKEVKKICDKATTIEEHINVADEYVKAQSWYKYIKPLDISIYQMLFNYEIMNDDDNTIWFPDTPADEKKKGVHDMEKLISYMFITNID